MLQSVRTKTLGVISFTLASLLLLLAFASHSILLDSFLSLEKDDAHDNIMRVRSAVDENIRDLERDLQDYAFWDDAYQFMTTHNPAFISANFIEDTFSTNRWDAALIMDLHGKILYSAGFDQKKKQYKDLPEAWRGKIFSDVKRFTPTEPIGVVSGILLLEEGLLLVAARHILPTKPDQPPKGLMLSARFLTELEIQQIAESTRVMLRSIPWSDAAHIPSHYLKSKSRSELDQPHIIPLNDYRLEAWTLLRDLNDKPVMLLLIDLERKIYQQGKSSIFYLLCAVLVSGLVFGGAILFLLEKLVLARVFRLSRQVQEIGRQSVLKARVDQMGRDEIGALASHINGMLQAHESLNLLLEVEQIKTDKLLRNVLPESVAERLKEDNVTIAESFAEVTILFGDIVGFTKMAASNSAEQVVGILNEVFSEFDKLAEKHGLEKIKTIGDAYMVVGGLPTLDPQHALHVAAMALDMMASIDQFNLKRSVPLQIRIGINTGSVVAGVIGTKKFLYDLWGDSVNTASRMESSSEPAMIHVSETTYLALKDDFELSSRGMIEVKGKGLMPTYYLIRRKTDSLDETKPQNKLVA